MARAFADAPRAWRIVADGAGIEVLEWGPPGGDVVLLLHGQGAHADWWRFIAPLLAQGRRVVAPTLSGMGGSDWRDTYTLQLWAGEIAAVVAAAGLGSDRLALVGHSFGCLVLLEAMRLMPAAGSMALIDFYLPPPGQVPRQPPVRKVRRYDSAEAARARFRLSPPQACANTAIIDYIAHRTLRRLSTSPPCWSWVSDPRTMQRSDHARTRRNLAAVTAPLSILRGGRSALMDEDVAAHVRAVAPAHARFIEIPDADHHVPLDQPIATVAALNALLAVDGL